MSTSHEGKASGVVPGPVTRPFSPEGGWSRTPCHAATLLWRRMLDVVGNPPEPLHTALSGRRGVATQEVLCPATPFEVHGFVSPQVVHGDVATPQDPVRAGVDGTIALLQHLSDVEAVPEFLL